MATLAILNEQGDEKIKWDINKEDETKAAKKKFDELKEKKYMFYYVDKDGNQKGEMKDFDPLADTIIAIPQVRKG